MLIGASCSRSEVFRAVTKISSIGGVLEASVAGDGGSVSPMEFGTVAWAITCAEFKVVTANVSAATMDRGTIIFSMFFSPSGSFEQRFDTLTLSKT
jgi:hypothetical protein